MRKSTILVGGCILFLLFHCFLWAQNLEIHVINVGWGASLLVKGPDGTTVLMDAGNTGKGTNEVVPYLQSIGIQAANGLDYTIVDRKSTRLNSSHIQKSRMPSSA